MHGKLAQKCISLKHPIVWPALQLQGSSRERRGRRREEEEGGRQGRRILLAGEGGRQDGCADRGEILMPRFKESRRGSEGTPDGGGCVGGQGSVPLGVERKGDTRQLQPAVPGRPDPPAGSAVPSGPGCSVSSAMLLSSPCCTSPGATGCASSPASEQNTQGANRHGGAGPVLLSRVFQGCHLCIEHPKCTQTRSGLAMNFTRNADTHLETPRTLLVDALT